jgi:flagellar biosynthesis chaperone FliJ
MSITLKDGTTSILDMSEIETFLNNYHTEVETTQNKISTTEASLQTEKENLKDLYASNLLSPNDSYTADIQESEAAISNYENILQIEKERLKGLEGVLQEPAFQTLLQDYSAQIRADVSTFKNTDEKTIWEQLADLRDQQEVLLQELNTARGKIESEIFKFNSICKKAGKNITATAGFHKNLHMVNPVSKESGILFPNTNVSSDVVIEKFEDAKRGVQR